MNPAFAHFIFDYFPLEDIFSTNEEPYVTHCVLTVRKLTRSDEAKSNIRINKKDGYRQQNVGQRQAEG